MIKDSDTDKSMYSLARPWAELAQGLKDLPPAPAGGGNTIKDVPGHGVTAAEAVHHVAANFDPLKPTEGQHG